ncbi:CCA tRNA nucleotidyltransferase [Thermodesulfovibrio yellowstonii]|uniref:tRNA nucleotidyltransferase/poly(A) polymerase n=1 Tax=Thermodesulfovibrio yellowstonii (strain ATCC 51303 / DSM 11347 / YP87) TaxID=289376 RepID=B5YJ88_THEYD|nr:CCA tRNA nucleotidyltransferase [Thermodesulfovibrio yellowstonii]ACI21169.1 tRNA nucleotidyltransferase/poly(A) polymerase [Thermodesulfovibrio yellowstonii DSM 11347]
MFETLRENKYFNEVVKFLQEKKLYQNSYLVGGSVRDLLLKRDLKDIDFAIKGDSIDLAKEFSRKIGGTFVLLDEVFSIGRVVKDNVTIDFAQLSGESIETDLSERDFTINAMATDLSLKNLIDPFGGMEDLKNRLIKMVKEENLKADPLRILRAYRFHATVNFDIENNTREALKKNAFLMKVTAKERIKEELWKILSVDNSARTVEMMVEDEIFKAFFKMPDLLQIRPNLQVLIIIEEALRNPEKIFTHHKITFNPNIIACLKFTGIFGHHALSFIKQIKPSKKEERFVEKLIEAGVSIKKVETLLDKVRFVKNYENVLYPALIYGISTDPLGMARAWFYREIENFYKKVYLKNKKKLPLIKGEDILSLGFEPSPLVGEIIERIETLVLAGKISKKEEALEEIKRRYGQNRLSE